MANFNFSSQTPITWEANQLFLSEKWRKKHFLSGILQGIFDLGFIWGELSPGVQSTLACLLLLAWFFLANPRYFLHRLLLF